VNLTMTGASTYTVDFLDARSFDGSVTFGAGSAANVRMASFGPPVTGAAVFIVEGGGGQKTITVSAAGLVTVQ
jgi:hypothetical protein